MLLLLFLATVSAAFFWIPLVRLGRARRRRTFETHRHPRLAAMTSVFTWTQVMVIAGTLVLVLLAVGYFSSFTLDIEDLCGARGEVFSPAVADQPSSWSFFGFPFSERCNATYDLVPSFVNPGIAVSLGVGMLATAGVLVQSIRRPEELDPSGAPHEQTWTDQPDGPGQSR